MGCRSTWSSSTRRSPTRPSCWPRSARRWRNATARVGCIGAQLVVVSNAGDERSTLLNEQRELGRRAALEGDTSGCGSSGRAPDDADPFDEDVWRATIPTLEQPDGIGLEFVRMEAESMRLDDFRREYLCVHTARPVARVIDPVVWAALPGDELDADAGVVLAVDAPQDRSSAAVVAAGRLGDDDDDVVIAVEVVEQRPGAEWVAGYVADARRRPITPRSSSTPTGRWRRSSRTSSAPPGCRCAAVQGRPGRRRRRRVL